MNVQAEQPRLHLFNFLTGLIVLTFGGIAATAISIFLF
jgi:hypothetical protein